MNHHPPSSCLLYIDSFSLLFLPICLVKQQQHERTYADENSPGLNQEQKSRQQCSSFFESTYYQYHASIATSVILLQVIRYCIVQTIFDVHIQQYHFTLLLHLELGGKREEGGAAPALCVGSTINGGLFICFEILTAAWTGLGDQSPDFAPFLSSVPDLDRKYLVSVDLFETSQLSPAR